MLAPKPPLFPYTTLFRSSTYQDQRRTEDAMALLEEVLEKRRKILGVEHPDTLTSMNNLASTYRDQGRTDRKSTRLNSSHRCSSYAVFCLKNNTLTSMNNL